MEDFKKNYVEASFVDTNRGGRKLMYNGYTYTKDRQTSTSCNWRCSLARQSRCRARAITKELDGTEFVRLSGSDHTHDTESDTYSIVHNFIKFG